MTTTIQECVMSKKTEADQHAEQDREVRLQGEKSAVENSAGRGHQPTIAEQGGREAVDKLHERREQSEQQAQQYDDHNEPIQPGQAPIDHQADDAARLQRRNHDPGPPDKV